MKLLLYCTKQPLYLVRNENDKYYYTMDKGTLNDYKNVETYNGKIVAECDFEVEKIECIRCDLKWIEYHYISKSNDEKKLLEKSCLSFPELQYYLKLENGYAIRIKNLNIFDKPKELMEYDVWKPSVLYGGMIKVRNKIAPQNMKYVYKNEKFENDNGRPIFGIKENKYILISIRPEQLCKILNGEQTILVRKKVLKEMI